MVFNKHYSPDEAQALIPRIRGWLDQLLQLRVIALEYERKLSGILEEQTDLGGPQVNRWIRSMAGIKGILSEFHRREIQIKDLERGLIDFPAFIGGREVFLCWEKSEESVEYWHDLDSGYAGREPL